MKSLLFSIFLIVGSVIGSGFSSGKEMVVYFARFGKYSYLYILITCVLFVFVFYILLNNAGKAEKRLKKSYILNLINIFICFIFASSMFAGLKSLISDYGTIIYIVLCIFLIISCLFVTIIGLNSLQKINLILMPVIIIIFFIVLIYCSSLEAILGVYNSTKLGIFFSPLYVILNTSTAGIVISQSGKKLTKKQTWIASIVSTAILSVFLLFGNFILQRNFHSFQLDMPFLYLVKTSSILTFFMKFVIFVGCITSLFSLCLTLKISLNVIVKKEISTVLITVFVPFVISEFGFSEIVSIFYPIASVLGIYILFDLFLIPFFKQTNNKIHTTSEKAEDKGASHY